jgi:hypothetical protein
MAVSPGGLLGPDLKVAFVTSVLIPLAITQLPSPTYLQGRLGDVAWLPVRQKKK